MAEAFIVGIFELIAELLTHALVFLRPRQAAGTVSARAFKPLFYCLYYLFVGIQSYCHVCHLCFCIDYKYIITKNPSNYNQLNGISFASGKLGKKQFADIMAGKNVEIKDADIERARKFLDAARSKFEDDFISSRYLIDAAISLQGKKGEESNQEN